MPGSLGAIDLMQPEDLREGSAKLSVLQDALTGVLSRGLVLPDKPSDTYDGKALTEITRMDDNQLGELLAIISQYAGYVESELAKAYGAKVSAQAQLEYVTASIRVRLRSQAQEFGGKLTNPDKDDIVNTNPEVVAARQAYLYADSFWMLAKTVKDRVQRDWDTVSRRITQRGQEVDRGRRELNTNASTGPLNSFSTASPPRRSFRRP